MPYKKCLERPEMTLCKLSVKTVHLTKNLPADSPPSTARQSAGQLWDLDKKLIQRAVHRPERGLSGPPDRLSHEPWTVR